MMKLTTMFHKDANVPNTQVLEAYKTWKLCHGIWNIKNSIWTKLWAADRRLPNKTEFTSLFAV